MRKNSSEFLCKRASARKNRFVLCWTEIHWRRCQTVDDAIAWRNSAAVEWSPTSRRNAAYDLRPITPHNRGFFELMPEIVAAGVARPNLARGQMLPFLTDAGFRRENATFDLRSSGLKGFGRNARSPAMIPRLPIVSSA